MGKRMVKIDYRDPSAYSDGVADPKLIVLHDWEADVSGIKGLKFLKGILDGNELSVHFGVTSDGKIGQYLRPTQIGRHVLHHNTGAVGIEQGGYASYSKKKWLTTHHWQLIRVARLLAQLSRDYDIPLVHSTTHGVAQHRDMPDNDHTDCGANYPFFYVLRLARMYRKTVFR